MWQWIRGYFVVSIFLTWWPWKKWLTKIYSAYFNFYKDSSIALSLSHTYTQTIIHIPHASIISLNVITPLSLSLSYDGVLLICLLYCVICLIADSKSFLWYGNYSVCWLPDSFRFLNRRKVLKLFLFIWLHLWQRTSLRE